MPICPLGAPHLTPTDPEPNNILHDLVDSDVKQDEENNISRDSHFHKIEELQAKNAKLETDKDDEIQKILAQ